MKKDLVQYKSDQLQCLSFNNVQTKSYLSDVSISGIINIYYQQQIYFINSLPIKHDLLKVRSLRKKVNGSSYPSVHATMQLKDREMKLHDDILIAKERYESSFLTNSGSWKWRIKSNSLIW